jgi:ATP-dependent Lon protease
MPQLMTTYTPEEIAERLDRHVNSIRRNLRKGQLEGEKWSNEWIVTDEALQEWLPVPVYQEHFGEADGE